MGKYIDNLICTECSNDTSCIILSIDGLEFNSDGTGCYNICVYCTECKKTHKINYKFKYTITSGTKEGHLYNNSLLCKNCGLNNGSILYTTNVDFKNDGKGYYSVYVTCSNCNNGSNVVYEFTYELYDMSIIRGDFLIPIEHKNNCKK